jgi:hypothetical protein
MKALLPRCIASSLQRFNKFTVPPFGDFKFCRMLVLVALLSPLLAHGQAF